MSSNSILYETYLLQRYRNMFSIDSLQVNSISNNTILSGNTSVFSDFYVPTNTTININASIGTFLYVNDFLNITNNMTSNSNLYIINNGISQNVSVLSNLQVSGVAFLSNDVSIISTLTVSSASQILNMSMLANLYISNYSILNYTTIRSDLSITQASIFNNPVTFLSNLNISNSTLFYNDTSILSNLYVSQTSLFNNCTINSNLFISNLTIINNLTSLSNLTVNNQSLLNNCIAQNGTLINSLTISNTTTINYMNIYGQIVNQLFDYPSNDAAIIGGVPLWGLYRTGGIIKIRINTVSSIITLNGFGTMNSSLGQPFNDPGASIINGSNSTIETVGTVSINKLGAYIRYYNALDSNGYIINTVSRIINII